LIWSSSVHRVWIRSVSLFGNDGSKDWMLMFDKTFSFSGRVSVLILSCLEVCPM
jgi:hypothetical protein